MKKFIATLLSALMICTMLAACGGSDSSTSEAPKEPTKESATTQTQDEAKPTPSDSGEIGSYAVKLLDGEVTEDYEGNPAFRIEYEFTNNGDEATSADVGILLTAYQDGVELESTLGKDYDSDKEYSNLSKNVKTGVTITCAQYFETSSDTSDIEVEASDWLSFDNSKVTKTYTLK